MLKLIPARTLTISINQLEYFATGFFATAMAAGSLTLFEIAQRLISAPIRIFAVPIGQASLPFLSQETDSPDQTSFKDMVVKSLHKILFLALPASIILIILRIPLVRILYGAKSFPWSATLLTGRAVAILSLSIFAQSAHHILSRAFYAMENTKTPLKIASLAMVLNLAMSYLATFVFHLGILGIAWALLISSLFHVVVLTWVLHRRTGGFNLAQLFSPITKMLLATLITGVFLWLPMRLLDQFVFDTTRTVPLIILTIIVTAIGFWVYLLLSKWLKIAELSEFTILLRKFGNWQKVLDSSDEVIETASPSQEINPS
jgi:putative peptidoglycan lipid II flippase